MKKICFAASSGGHLEELSQLKKIRDEYNCFLVTEKGGFSNSDFCKKIYLVKQINRREIFFIFKFISLFFISTKILIKEKPDFIITTGVLAAYPLCVVGKIMRKKIIYIESFARIDSASLTGKLVYPFADLFIVQWEENLKYYPKAVYGGSIF